MKQDHIKQPKKIHFIGIGGSGMLPLARFAMQKHFEISGSDSRITDALEGLKSKGIVIYNAHVASHVSDCDIVVYSSAIEKSNPELMHARKMGLKILHRSEFLDFLCTDRKCIAVSGTHGKTTTSALITHILKSADEDPLSIIGGISCNYNTNMLPGNGELAVIEADESDGSFLNYRPHVGVITNIDQDHLDHYKNLDGIISAFKAFIDKVDPEGAIILNWDNEHCLNLRNQSELNTYTFGRRIGSDVRLIDYKYEDSHLIIDLMIERDRIKVRSKLIGAHNIQNILCAICTCVSLEIPVEKIITAVESFKGVERRLSKILEDLEKNIVIIDDYAHNPTKIESTLEAIAEAYPEHKIHALFEPHRYSRLETMYNEIVSSFCPTTMVSVLPVYSAGEKPSKSFSLRQLAKDIGLYSQTRIESFTKIPNPSEIINGGDPENTIFVTLGAGYSHQIAKKLRDYLHDKKKT